MRFKHQKDYENDCITICDDEDELKTSYDSDITLAPMEDAVIVVNKMNEYEAVIRALRQQLASYLSDEDIDYLIAEAVEDFEDD